MRNIYDRILIVGMFIFVLAAAWIFIDLDSVGSESELISMFNTSLDDVDFSNEITGHLSVDYQDENFKKSVSASNTEQDTYNRLRGWGIKRGKNHKSPQPDPGTPEILKKYGGKYIGDTNSKRIYLTFDEGYENGYTPKILDTLSKNHVKAIFFITGPYLNEHQDLVRRMVEEGHEVGNHTVKHPSLPTVDNKRIEDEILGLERTFKEKFGKKMIFLRPPKGEYSERTLEITQKMGYVNLFWSFAYDDWNRNQQRGWEYAYNKVMENLHDGAILLLHAVSKDNAEALDRIIQDTCKSGYEFGEPLELVNTVQ